jgi:hypothetical protein
VGKPKGKRPLKKPTRRLEDNIKMNFREIRLGDMDLIDLVQIMEKWKVLVKTVKKL